jgi:hypothetical protein
MRDFPLPCGERVRVRGKLSSDRPYPLILFVLRAGILLPMEEGDAQQESGRK